MAFHYVILGTGRQGVAAAYDLLRFGDAGKVVLADNDERRAAEAVNTLNRLLGDGRATARTVDVSNESALLDLLRGSDAAISAVPHFFNEAITRAAIAARTNLCDLGGNTDVVRAQHALTSQAQAAGVRVVPDCGLAPGLNNTLSMYAIGLLDEPREVRSFCGGLPQEPKGPLFYSIVFSIHGLVGEYSGTAYYLRNGKITPVEAFTEPEPVDTAIGRLEAFVTSGGTSTAPWTLEGKIQRYEYKTLRYPGHYERVRAMIDLGLLDTKPVRVKSVDVAPRDLFCAVVGKRLDHGRTRDVVIQRVIARGRHQGREAEITIDLVDRYDEATGFAAMERTTGFATAIVCTMLAKKEVPTGVVSLETAIDAKQFVNQFRQRGLELRITGP